MGHAYLPFVNCLDCLLLHTTIITNISSKTHPLRPSDITTMMSLVINTVELVEIEPAVIECK